MCKKLKCKNEFSIIIYYNIIPTNIVQLKLKYTSIFVLFWSMYYNIILKCSHDAYYGYTVLYLYFII